MSLHMRWTVPARSNIPYTRLLLVCLLAILFSLVEPERAAAKTSDQTSDLPGHSPTGP